VSRCGEHGIAWYVVAAVCGAIDKNRRDLYWRATGTVLLAFCVNQFLKLFVRRPRPELEGLPPLMPTHSNRSYPSAHATTSFAAARSLSPALPTGPLYACAACMALTRPYLGVHYPSDTLAGAGLGWATARLLS
jgi:decaprenylphosphoryl-5-phosphoribose phosphatase